MLLVSSSQAVNKLDLVTRLLVNSAQAINKLDFSIWNVIVLEGVPACRFLNT